MRVVPSLDGPTSFDVARIATDVLISWVQPASDRPLRVRASAGPARVGSGYVAVIAAVRDQRPGGDLIRGARPVEDGQGQGDRSDIGGQTGCSSGGRRRGRAEGGSEPDRAPPTVR